MQIFQGKIVSCDEKNHIYRYLVENNGKIEFVGDQLPPSYQNVPIKNLGQKALLPAFVDTHIHFSSWAFFNSNLYLSNVSSFEELGKIIRAYVAQRKEKILIGFGVSAHNVKEHRLPTKNDLDEWCPNRPLFLVKYDGHAAVCNSAMLSRFPENIKTQRGYHADSGFLNQEAFFKGTDFVTASVPIIKLIQNMLKGFDTLASRGIGMIHTVEGVGFPKDMDVDLARIIAKNIKDPFQMRIFFQTMDSQKVLKRKLPRIGGCFICALDGCYGSEDAALLVPYSNNSQNKGILYYTDTQVEKFTKEAHNAGLQIELHAIGDAAFVQASNALAKAIQANPRSNHRHTIIHACLPTLAGLQKCAELGICIASQPGFLYWDQEPLEYSRSILGDRVDAISPHRKMLDLGIHVAGGSDGPCTAPNPIEGIYCACNHYVPGQSVTIAEALRMFTWEAAYLSFDEDTRGSLEVGKVADFTLLNTDPFALASNQLRSLKVQQLYLAGVPYQGKMGIGGLLFGLLSARGKKRKI